MIHILRRFIITVLFILLSQILSCAGNKLQIPIFSWSVRVFCSGLDIAISVTPQQQHIDVCEDSLFE